MCHRLPRHLLSEALTSPTELEAGSTDDPSKGMGNELELLKTIMKGWTEPFELFYAPWSHARHGHGRGVQPDTTEKTSVVPRVYKGS